MITVKTTLSLLILTLLAKESPKALHSSLRGFPLDMEKREKPGILLESREEVRLLFVYLLFVVEEAEKERGCTWQ
jgi:hypothetical protein